MLISIMLLIDASDMSLPLILSYGTRTMRHAIDYAADAATPLLMLICHAY